MSANKDKYFGGIRWEALQNTVFTLIILFYVFLLQSLYAKTKIITLAVKDYNVSWLHELLKNTHAGIEKPQLLSLSFFVQGSLRQLHTSYQHTQPSLETTNYQRVPFSLMIAMYNATTHRRSFNMLNWNLY